MRRPAWLWLTAAVASLPLAACDAIAPREAEPAPPAAPAPERSTPIRWNLEAGRFELGGKPLRAIKLWTFEGSTEGYTSPAGGIGLAEGAGLWVKLANPVLRSPRGLAVDGSRYSVVLVRLTRLKAGAGWNGALYYSTTQHGEAADYLGKPLWGGDPAVGETSLLVYDMGRQTVGGEDWKQSVIDQVRLDLENGAGGEFLIHQIAIAQRANLAAPAP